MSEQRSAACRLVFLVVALLLGIAGSSPVGAQQRERFDSETYDVSFEWNGDLWGNTSSSSFEGRETLQIASGASVFFIEIYERGRDDATDCIRSARRSIERAEGVTDFKTTTALDLPEFLSGTETLLVTYDIAIDGRDNPVSFAQFVSCQQIEGDGLLLIGGDTRLGIYDEELDIFEPLLASFVIDGEPVSDGN